MNLNLNNILVCEARTTSLKGVKIRKFPDVLTFSLKRFEYDWETDTRKKINDKFEYPLELDVSPY